VKPPFKNRPNARHTLPDGRVLYESRSVAVTAVVVAYEALSREHFVVVGRRGPAVDLAGLHCLVCGYLDWDESLADAVRREVWEEAALDLRELERIGRASVPDQPVFVQSVPSAHRQNVTARFVIELDGRAPLGTQNAEPEEVASIAWLPVTRAAVDELAWAFNHDAILHELADFYTSERDSGALDAGSTRRFARALLERR
jgi:8-oxo-dGTP pyrophosphatase MutT (NUDIX family)